MAVMTLSPACEGSIHAEEGHTSPSLLDPSMGWVRNIPLPTLVAYREKVSRPAGGCRSSVSLTECRAGIPQGDPSRSAPRTTRVLGDRRFNWALPRERMSIPPGIGIGRRVRLPQ